MALVRCVLALIVAFLAAGKLDASVRNSTLAPAAPLFGYDGTVLRQLRLRQLAEQVDCGGLLSSRGVRKAALLRGGSLADPVPRFTGKERDGETGLDYFGARYFSGAQGRFTGPDPLLNSGRPWEPQSWNRYAYALNNPLRFNNPTGLYEWAASGCADDDKKCLKQYQQNQDRFRQGLRSLQKARDAYKKGSREYNRLDSALQAYGKENDPNGVKVGFAALSGSAEGRTIPENNLASFTVLFDPKKIAGSGTDWAITVGHEGTHVSDFRLPMSDLQLLTPFSVECRGYETSAFVFQGLFSGHGTGELSFGKGGNRVVIWNTGWAEADRQTLRDKGITKHVVNAYGHPETTPHNPLNH
jgi:RHS repeat-associated protein